MTDYEDLAFEPEMTWEDLKQWVRQNPKYGLNILDEDEEFQSIEMCKFDCIIKFWNDGDVWSNGGVINNKRTPAQMKAIIENLFE